MPCPKCRSYHLWDDNLAWGCHDCDFFTTGHIQNTGSSRDIFLTHEEYDERKEEAAKRKAEANNVSEGGLFAGALDVAGNVLGAAGNMVTSTADVAGSVITGAADVAGGVACAIGSAIGSIAD